MTLQVWLMINDKKVERPWIDDKSYLAVLRGSALVKYKIVASL